MEWQRYLRGRVKSIAMLLKDAWQRGTMPNSLYLCQINARSNPMTTESTNKTDNGSETPKRKKRAPKDRLALGISLGMLFGTAVGSIDDDIALWIPIGVMFGVVFGLIEDKEEQTKYTTPKSKSLLPFGVV